MKPSIGSLYSYFLGRNLLSEDNKYLCTIKAGEPFVVLTVEPNETLKVLTIKGDIGWVIIGTPKNLVKLS